LHPPPNSPATRFARPPRCPEPVKSLLHLITCAIADWLCAGGFATSGKFPATLGEPVRHAERASPPRCAEQVADSPVSVGGRQRTPMRVPHHDTATRPREHGLSPTPLLSRRSSLRVLRAVEPGRRVMPGPNRRSTSRFCRACALPGSRATISSNRRSAVARSRSSRWCRPLSARRPSATLAKRCSAWVVGGDAFRRRMRHAAGRRAPRCPKRQSPAMGELWRKSKREWKIRRVSPLSRCPTVVPMSNRSSRTNGRRQGRGARELFPTFLDGPV
jgi:hypothetical protein